MPRTIWLLILTAVVSRAQQSSTRHDRIVVTGTYDPVPLEESDRSVDVEPVLPDRNLVANTLADFLKLDSSVDLRERAPNDIQADVSIRGGGFGQTLILLDGMRLNDVQSGHHNLDVPVPLETLDRIEILKGAGSTLYGSDAVGGVINFVTRTPEASDLTIRTAIGNFGTNQQRAVANFVLGSWAQELAFSRDFSTGFMDDRDYRNLDFASLTHVATKLGATNLVLAYSDRPFGANQFYGNFNSWERTKGWFAGARQALGKKTEVIVAFRRHTDLFVLYRDNPALFSNRHAVESLQAAVRRRETLGRNIRLHYGAETIHDSIESNNLGNHARTRGSAFAALDVRALRRFSFSLGAREEVYGSGQTQFSPSATGGVWLTPKLKLHGAATHAFRLPSYTDLYYHDPANVGSPDLRPEKAWDFEGGLDYDFTPATRARVTVFHLREKDIIDYTRPSVSDIYRATNFEKLNFTGVEASLQAALGKRQRVNISYTGLHGSLSISQVLMSKYVANYPVHEAVVGWQAALPGAILLRTRVGALERVSSNAYAVWDFYAARATGRLRPFIQFTNLTNTVYQEIQGVAMPKRGVVGGIELKIFGATN